MRQLGAGAAGPVDVPVDVAGADEAYRTNDGELVYARVDDVLVTLGSLMTECGDVTSVTEQLITEAVANMRHSK